MIYRQSIQSIPVGTICRIKTSDTGAGAPLSWRDIENNRVMPLSELSGKLVTVLDKTNSYSSASCISLVDLGLSFWISNEFLRVVSPLEQLALCEES